MPNTPVIVTGLIVFILGIITLIHPNASRWINLPGDARLKAFGSMIIGIILIIVSFTT
jgi:hypothetical protein